MIAIVIGSKSDLTFLEKGINICEQLSIPYNIDVISAHRHPEKLRRWCKQLKPKGVKVVIACAGLAAALPGAVASYVDLPVIGVPLPGGMLDGLDSLLSIVQVPKGIGLVSTGPGSKGFINAIIFSLQILSLKEEKYRQLLQKAKTILNK